MYSTVAIDASTITFTKIESREAGTQHIFYFGKGGGDKEGERIG